VKITTSTVKASKSDGPAGSTAFAAAVVNYFVAAADLLGVPKSLAMIYGVCFASAEPLSAADIKARTALSAGTLSQGLRFLSSLGALREVAVPGQRASKYVPDVELRKLLLHYFEHRVEAHLRAGAGRINEIHRSLPPQDPAAKILSARVKSLRRWHAKSQALLPLVKGALKLG
jgi:DNA-binding transcriptional regulator GbsR (MarR family)